MRIIAIDPGMASCGIALLEHPRRLLDFEAMTTMPNRTDGKTDKTNADAIRRAMEITTAVLTFIQDAIKTVGPVDAVVIEEFVDIAKAKGRAGLWTTPMAIGYMVAEIRAAFPDIPIRWSNPSNLPPHAKREARWAELVPIWGMEEVDRMPATRREHVQSAALHGIHYLEHNRIKAAARR